MVLFRLLKHILHGMTDKSNFNIKVCLGSRRNKKSEQEYGQQKKTKIYDLSTKPGLKYSNFY